MATGRQVRALWLILGTGLLAKALLAVYLPLAIDETYAIAVSREFSWSFFDHPPLGFWSAAVSGTLFGESYPAFRLPYLLYGLGTGYLLYRIGAELAGARAGLWAAVLYNITPFFVVSGGMAVVPDGPLELGLSFAMFNLLRAAKTGETRFWLRVGIGLAVAFASKYQAVLFPLAVVLYALATPSARVWFRQKGPYIASGIALLGFLPVLVWNAQNGWISFAFQGGRGGFGLDPLNFARMVAGQMLYLLPVSVLALRAMLRGLKTPELRLTAFVAITPVAVFNLLYLFTSGSLPHWPMSGWLFALPLAGVLLAARPAPRLVPALGVLSWLLVAALALQARTGLFTPDPPPAWDQTREVFDWRGLKPALEQSGALDGVKVLAAPDWQDAGIVSTALGGAYPVRVLDDAPHHFAFMSGPRTGGRGLLLRPVYAADTGAAAAELLRMARAIDPQARALPPVVLSRGSAPYIAVLPVSLVFRE